MIEVYGAKELNSRLVRDTDKHQALLQEAQSLPKVLLNSAAAANAVMLGGGYFTPLNGYMSLADGLSVAKNMHTTEGLFWPVPIFNFQKEKLVPAKRIALCDPNRTGNPIMAIQEVHDIEPINSEQLSEIARHVFGTDSMDHAGVKNFCTLGNYVISGDIYCFDHSYFDKEFSNTYKTAYDIRALIAEHGWERVVAFQTRNPMHRAHEALCKMVADEVNADGILIHMLLGKLKPGDIPADVRDAAIRTMVKHYFNDYEVLVTGYGFDMLYAGPREALLHAIFRQNCGCSHLIVGRDHAGVGDYYEPFAAQDIFDEVPKDALAIRIAKADHTAYSKKLNKVIYMRDAIDHKPEDFVLLSGTKVREMLSERIALPEEFARPEVAKILMDYYATQT